MFLFSILCNFDWKVYLLITCPRVAISLYGYAAKILCLQNTKIFLYQYQSIKHSPPSFLLKSLRNVACCLRTLNNSNNIQCKIDINSNAKLKSQRNIFVWNDDWSSYLDLILMVLILKSNIWNLNIPPIFITKSLDSNSKERWFSTRIIATNQNDTNKLYQQKIKINNSLWEEIIKASWNANLCLKVKSKEYFHDLYWRK